MNQKRSDLLYGWFDSPKVTNFFNVFLVFALNRRYTFPDTNRRTPFFQYSTGRQKLQNRVTFRILIFERCQDSSVGGLASAGSVNPRI